MSWYIRSPEFDADRVSRLEHNFHEHPGLAPDALRALALRMQQRHPACVKFIDPAKQHDSKFWLQNESYDGRSLDEVFDTLDQPGTWIAIYEAGKDDAFREVVRDVINAGTALLSGRQADIIDQDAYVFISSPPSLTPFHIDRENNFLLQIRGSKRITVWEPYHPQALTKDAVEKFVLEKLLEDVRYAPGLEDAATVNNALHASEGVFMPATAPHMTTTEPGDSTEPSVTVGFVSYSAELRRRANILAANRVLRRLGFDPDQPGGPMDWLKYPVGYGAARLLDRLGKIDLPRGF